MVVIAALLLRRLYDSPNGADTTRTSRPVEDARNRGDTSRFGLPAAATSAQFGDTWRRMQEGKASPDEIYAALSQIRACSYTLPPSFDESAFETRLMKSIDKSSPNHELQASAVEKLHSFCSGVARSKPSAEQISHFYEEAAAGGQKAAQAYLLATHVGPGGKFSEANLETACGLFKDSINDPNILIELIPYIVATPKSVLFGVPYSLQTRTAFSQALDLVSCYYAADRCGSDAMPLTELCATTGQCYPGQRLDDVLKARVLESTEYRSVSMMKDLTIEALQQGNCQAVGLK